MDVTDDDVQALAGYPGRGIVVHRGADEELHWVYFITGRSPASRARRFVRRPGALAVQPTDAGATFDELRHYLCATGVDGSDQIVVGNGDHVATIAQLLAEGADLTDAAAELAPEPDPPMHTPRIAVVLDPRAAQLVIVRDVDGQPDRLIQPIEVRAGDGIVVRTYDGDRAEPHGTAPVFRCTAPPDAPLPEMIWQVLDRDLRVGLAAGSARSAEPTVLLP